MKPISWNLGDGAIQVYMAHMRGIAVYDIDVVDSQLSELNQGYKEQLLGDMGSYVSDDHRTYCKPTHVLSPPFKYVIYIWDKFDEHYIHIMRGKYLFIYPPSSQVGSSCITFCLGFEWITYSMMDSECCFSQESYLDRMVAILICVLATTGNESNAFLQ